LCILITMYCVTLYCVLYNVCLNMWGVLDTTLCDRVCQWLATGQWFSPGTPVFSTNKFDHHDITEILMKVALNTKGRLVIN
jgi:hypothetical protein